MKSELTIVVPTHNRHHLLARLLPTLLGLDVPLLIIDSTSQPYPNPPTAMNVTYIHCPGMGILEKLRKYISECVSTPFMLMDADDTFPLKTSVMKALQFLKEHPDYSSAQGVTYLHRDGRFEQHRKDAELYQCDSVRPSIRILQHHVCDIHNFYGVQRTDCWKYVLGLMPDALTNPTLTEEFQLMASLIHGKSKRTNDFFHVIDEVPSLGSNEGGMTPPFTQERYAPQFELFKSILAAAIVEKEPMPIVAARRYIDSALSLLGLLHVDRSLYYWRDARIPPRKRKTLAEKIASEWQRFLGKTFCKKQKAERRAAQKRLEDEQAAAHMAQALAASSPEIRQEFEAIRKILQEA